MTDSGKMRLSAKEILADIRSGLDASALKRKYGLSDKSLDKVYLKLYQAGLLKKHEKPLRASTAAPIASHLGDPQGAEWKCPACGKAQASEVPECPICGIVVAKYLRREAQQTSGSTVSRISVSDGTSRDRNWTAVAASIVVLGLLGASILLWSGHRGQGKTEMASMDVSSEASSGVRIQKDQSDQAITDRHTSNITHAENKIEDTPRSETAPQPLIHPPLEPTFTKVSPPQEMEPLPKVEARPKPRSATYVTGVLRHFHSRDFKREVVEASKMYPVVFQFYSDT
jgi:hypothetical protein